MWQYSTNVWDTYAGWFHTSESDIGQAVPVGARDPSVGPSPFNNGKANQHSDLYIFHNQIKSVPGFVIEPDTLLDCIHRQPRLCLNYAPSTAARCNRNVRDTGNFGARL